MSDEKYAFLLLLSIEKLLIRMELWVFEGSVFENDVLVAELSVS